MTIDPTKFRVGDRVTVHGLVVFMDGHAKIRIEGRLEDCIAWVTPDQIATHTPAPKPIKVGDWVKIPHNAAPFLVVAIDGDTAWIKNRYGRAWRHLATLTPYEVPHARPD